MSDETLRLRAREAIRSKRVPDRHPERIWSGRAETDKCTICSAPVGGLGLDLEYAGGERTVCYSVHVDCFAAWELECEPRTPS